MTHKTAMAKKLATYIDETGPISVHDYIEACLYDPDDGYYRTSEAIGRTGDFITAPEISQMFGELIGLWAGEVWRLMGEPARVLLIELGPGRGVLMADALRALKIVPGFLAAATVHLVEGSRALRDTQKAVLSGASVPLFWHDKLSDVPEGPSIVIANEFFDCLPVRQYVFDASIRAWRERMVARKRDAFCLATGAVIEGPPGLPPNFAGEIEDGTLHEHRPAAQGIIQAIAARSPSAALIVDYGYSRPSFGDTVQAVRHHSFTGLFDAPGESDMTAHVDFSQLKQAAADEKLETFGPLPMGEWLLRLGLEARMQQLLRHACEQDADEIKRSVARLVDPAQMGALFKVLAVTRKIGASLPPY